MVEFFPNEHILDQQDEADRERITDTNFRIIGRIIKNTILSAKVAYRTGKSQSGFLSMMHK